MNVRSLLAFALAALLSPAIGNAAPSRGTGSRSGPVASSVASPALSVGGFVGYETDDVSGLTLRVDGELPFQALSPQVNLSWVGSIGFSHLTEDVPFGDYSVNILKIIPAARFSFPLNPQFSLFADAGLGLYYASSKLETDLPFFGKVSVSDSELSLLMRLGGGAWYAVNPKTRIGASIELTPYFGDFDQNTFTIQVGAMFNM
jgi:opacity protein-like surface antigen